MHFVLLCVYYFGMNNFNRGSQGRGGERSGDRGGFRGGSDRGGFGGGRRDFGNRGGGRDFGGAPTMHKTTCSDCGKVAEVPFKPTGDKPVLCSECFGAKRGDDRGSRGDSRDRNFSSDRNSPRTPSPDMGKVKEDIYNINKKIDMILGLLGHTPTEEKEQDSVKKTPKPEKPKAGELTAAVKKAVTTTKTAKTKVVKKAAKKAVKKVTKK